MLCEEKAKIKPLSFGSLGRIPAWSRSTRSTERSESGLLWRLFVLESSGLLDGPPEEELDLRVQAAQVVVRPPLDSIQQGWVDPKEEGLKIGRAHV